MISRRTGLKALAAGFIIALTLGQPALAAVDIDGYKFDDTAKVAGKDLKLNGAGSTCPWSFSASLQTMTGIRVLKNQKP